MPSKTIIAQFDVAPGAHARFMAIMQEHARITKSTEPGCQQFDIVRVTDANGATDTSKLVLVETYASEAAYLEHTRQPRLPALRESYAGMLTGRSVIRGFVD